MTQLLRHELRQVADKEEYEIVIYLDDNMTEFAQELGTIPKEKGDFVSSVKELIKERYPKIKVTMLKVMIGGIAVTSIPLLGANMTSVEAAELPNSPTVQLQDVSSTYYTVQSGDTLYYLASYYNTSVNAIKDANQLSSNTLQVGQKLVIPKTMHTVNPGETLSMLARSYGTTVDSIRDANGLTNNLIRVGQSLTIPVMIQDAQVSTNVQADNQQYTVVPGDTLSAIAKRFGTSIDVLKSSNQLSSDLLRIGQTLTIPNINTDTQQTTHVVAVGDSLWAIANKYKVSIDALKTANALTSNLLSIGQEITIPTTGTGMKEKNIPTTNNEQYIVASGDSLWGIANKHNVTVDEIRVTNNLDNDTLQVGQKLIIPKESMGVLSPVTTPASSEATYKVVSGDTLYSVARNNNVSVDALKQANKLTTNNLTVGQVLTIPSKGDVTQESPTKEDVSVQGVQQSLKLLGYYAVPTMTGTYDASTTTAIKNFQSDYGISVSGKVDQETQLAIEHAVVKQSIIKDSVNYLGVPYLWGGTSPSGFDCSGFVYYMFNQHGIDMPRNTSSGLYKQGESISTNQLQPGDLVFFAVNSTGNISHVGFYMGDNQWISATSSKGIAVYSMDNSYWSKYYVGAKRVY
ncbi:C40 family peptidase [Ornithinibacillus halophilus]|uniref:Cell wall-associated hydrolase, NlpC family n=1 Tax=Ornithinibacillus halophilus TaxID=930117 RepID=A0A1M5FNY4_9BACI|nr:LysM peptidoglycan-binding domain-containing protein [Ornithinibacillus halophilus]SHF93250.1 Cell wall-associated hydrolase, NlpC family [Ornithinibacillus halophilus]